MQVMQDKVTGCLWSLFIGDAISMPVHWYYNLKGKQFDSSFDVTNGRHST